MKNRRWLRTMSIGLLVVLLGTAWVGFAPTEVGGPAAYVIVNGNSMEPGYHKGDLVVVRSEPRYNVGDIVAYRFPELGKVIHRIVAQEGDTFTLKGDHNTWLDSYQPTPADIIGKAWLYIPSLGQTIITLREPTNMAILAGLLGIAATASMVTGKKPRRRRGQAGQEQHSPMGRIGDGKEAILFILATVAFASLVLAAFAFTRPLTRAVPDDIHYDQAGGFTYTASAPGGVYNSTGPETGEPVYRKLTNRMTLDFTYGLLSTAASELNGTFRLNAEVSDVDGWKRTLPLQPDTPFSGNSFTTTVTLDLNAIQAQIDNLEKQAGVVRSSYTLAIIPEVSIQGTLDAIDLQENFSPRLRFSIDRLEVQVVKESNPLGGSNGSDTASPFKPSQKGLLKRDRSEPNSFALLFLTFDVAQARALSMVGLGLSLLGMLTFGLAMYLAGRKDEAASIAIKYGPLLLSVSKGLPETGYPIVDLATMDDLVKLAERDGRLVLHQIEGGTHYYLVQDTNVTYRYQTNGHHVEPADSNVRPAASGQST